MRADCRGLGVRKMRYFYDTEFIEDGKTIELISIGMTSEDGREFYAEVLETDVDLSKASDWVKENVIAHLWSRQPDKAFANRWTRDGGKGGLLSRNDIRAELRSFCNPLKYDKPEFWGYYSAYDHVALCQLFGTMMDLPRGYYHCVTCGNRLDKLPDANSKSACHGEYKKVSGWPMYTNDIKQLCDSLGNPKLPEQGKDEHHALADARWNQLAWGFLQQFLPGANPK